MRLLMPCPGAAETIRRTVSTPARWPSARGTPRRSAHRPLPSMMMATWRLPRPREAPAAGSAASAAGRACPARERWKCVKVLFVTKRAHQKKGRPTGRHIGTRYGPSSSFPPGWAAPMNFAPQSTSWLIRRQVGPGPHGPHGCQMSLGHLGGTFEGALVGGAPTPYAPRASTQILPARLSSRIDSIR